MQDEQHGLSGSVGVSVFSDQSQLGMTPTYPRSKVIELESFLFTCILHLGLVYQEFSSLQALPLIPQSNARLSNSGY